MKKKIQPDVYSITPMNEKLFSEFWRYQYVNDADLRTEDGTRLRVIYPGRPNDVQGADFKDAVVRSGRIVMKGDIELHLKTVDWQHHRHHTDKRYNRVILHVVLNSEKNASTTLQNGNIVPILRLENRLCYPLEQDIQQIQGIPCSGIGSGIYREKVLRIIEKEGEKRFFEKAAEIKNEAGKSGKDEALYRFIMKAMGYSGNTEPFLKLAGMLPLKKLMRAEQATLTDGEYLTDLQVLLLGSAGFLDTGYTGILTSSGIDSVLLRNLQERQSFSGNRILISPDDWQLFRIRPGNSPVRRLLAVCNMLVAFRKQGISNTIISAVDGIPPEKIRLVLEKLLIQCAEPDNLQKIQSGISSSLLGKGRAAVIVVNVLLPFLYTWEHPDKYLAAYLTCPGLPVNSLERHMIEQLGLEKTGVSKAVRQQGLVSLYTGFCTQGKCAVCELRKLESR